MEDGKVRVTPKIQKSNAFIREENWTTKRWQRAIFIFLLLRSLSKCSLVNWAYPLWHSQHSNAHLLFFTCVTRWACNERLNVKRSPHSLHLYRSLKSWTVRWWYRRLELFERILPQIWHSTLVSVSSSNSSSLKYRYCGSASAAEPISIIWSQSCSRCVLNSATVQNTCVQPSHLFFFWYLQCAR